MKFNQTNLGSLLPLLYLIILPALCPNEELMSISTAEKDGERLLPPQQTVSHLQRLFLFNERSVLFLEQQIQYYS